MSRHLACFWIAAIAFCGCGQSPPGNSESQAPPQIVVIQRPEPEMTPERADGMREMRRGVEAFQQATDEYERLIQEAEKAKASGWPGKTKAGFDAFNKISDEFERRMEADGKIAAGAWFIEQAKGKRLEQFAAPK